MMEEPFVLRVNDAYIELIAYNVPGGDDGETKPK